LGKDTGIGNQHGAAYPAFNRNALGTYLRNDIPFMMLGTLKDVYSYGNEGGNLMAKHGWNRTKCKTETSLYKNVHSMQTSF
jgi:hypothetical protein